MIEFEVNIVPPNKTSRSLCKVQIINIGKPRMNSKSHKYEVRVYDTDPARSTPESADMFNSAKFSHNRNDDLLVLIGKAMKALKRLGISCTRSIPRSKYKTVMDNGKKYEYVTYELVKQYHTAEETDSFAQFMDGQTSSVDGIYTWDYERWVLEGMRNAQSSSTWD